MSRVVIVGVGALGSHVALLLRNLPYLVLIDHDRVEQKNCQAQMHAQQSLGKNKAVSLSATIGSLFRPSGDRTAIAHKLTGANSDTLFAGATLVIDATDNGAARRAIQDACRKHAIPCLHGALSADGTFGRAVWMEHFKIDDESAEGAPTCEDGENLPFHGFAGAQIALIAQKFLKTGQRGSFQFTASSLVRLA